MDPMFVVMIAAISIAAIMSLVAWRVLREDRHRSEARIASLAADIAGASASNSPDLPLRDAAVQSVASESAPLPRRRVLATLAGAAVLVAGSIAAMVMATGAAYSVASGRVASEIGQLPGAPSRSPAEPPALELLALSHERVEDRLTVRGIVRNPASTVGAQHLGAVVLLFNAEGGFLTSGRASVDTAGLAPGTEAPFVVTIPGAADVGRYRVSFRSDDRVVPHVDRRR